MLVSIWRIFQYGVQGFRRNIWLSVIAVITMTLTLTTITIFALGDVIAVREYAEMNKKIDYIVFVKDSAAEADVQNFYLQIQGRGEVATTTLKTKDDARKIFEEQNKGVTELAGLITDDNNPLPREVQVTFHDPTQQIESFNTFVVDKKFEQVVERTSYHRNRGAIDNYARTVNVARLLGLFFTGFFIIVAVLVILNTIRLAIFARREEIEIMRLVGGTRGYIRGPFLVEGAFFGLLGALCSSVLFWVILRQLEQQLSDSQRLGTTNAITDMLNLAFGQITLPGQFNSLFSQLFLAQLLIGLVLGTLCSYVAARRYLRE
jgi:cell division transport system permease protein